MFSLILLQIELDVSRWNSTLHNQNTFRSHSSITTMYQEYTSVCYLRGGSPRSGGGEPPRSSPIFSLSNEANSALKQLSKAFLQPLFIVLSLEKVVARPVLSAVQSRLLLPLATSKQPLQLTSKVWSCRAEVITVASSSKTYR